MELGLCSTKISYILVLEICPPDYFLSDVHEWNCWNSVRINSLPIVPILGSPDLRANKEMMSKIWTNGDEVI